MLNSFEKLTQKPHPAIQFPLRIRLYKSTSNADTQSQQQLLTLHDQGRVLYM